MSVLILNCGSSTLKFRLFDVRLIGLPSEELLTEGEIAAVQWRARPEHIVF